MLTRIRLPFWTRLSTYDWRRSIYHGFGSSPRGSMANGSVQSHIFAIHHHPDLWGIEPPICRMASSSNVNNSNARTSHISPYNVTYFEGADRIVPPAAIPGHHHKSFRILHCNTVNVTSTWGVVNFNSASSFGNIHHHCNSIVRWSYHFWWFCGRWNRRADVTITALCFLFAKVDQFLIRWGPWTLDSPRHCALVPRCYSAFCHTLMLDARETEPCNKRQ